MGEHTEFPLFKVGTCLDGKLKTPGERIYVRLSAPSRPETTLYFLSLVASLCRFKLHLFVFDTSLNFFF